VTTKRALSILSWPLRLIPHILLGGLLGLYAYSYGQGVYTAFLWTLSGGTGVHLVLLLWLPVFAFLCVRLLASFGIRLW
jgi:hypothetical protein